MYVPASRVSLTRTSTPPPPQPRNSLQHVSVELFLPVAQELADHLPAEAFALQQEVRHPHWRVRHKAAFDEVLDALLRLPVRGRETGSAPAAPTPPGLPSSLGTPGALSCSAGGTQNCPDPAPGMAWDWAISSGVATGAGAGTDPTALVFRTAPNAPLGGSHCPAFHCQADRKPLPCTYWPALRPPTANSL